MCFQPASTAQCLRPNGRSASRATCAALALLLALLLAWSQGALAAQPVAADDCARPAARAAKVCWVGLQTDQMAVRLQPQAESQWCWAASISMLFAAAGFPVRQEDVVFTQFGMLADLPARARDITSLLNRTWRDVRGQGFAVSAQHRRPGRDAQGVTQEMLAELSAGRPLIIGVGSHAVVLGRVLVERPAKGGEVRVLGAMVMDPAPGAGLRWIDASALHLTYYAVVRVTPATGPDAIRESA